MSGDAYADIAFTPAVRDLQAANGSRDVYARATARDRGNDRLGPPEMAYIAERDGFYVASVSQSGWPYVQFRGGPPGFVRALDPGVIGWADLRGNQQFVTTGNVRGDDRVSLFFMDYPGRRRLKLFGRLGFVAAADAPDLARALVAPGQTGRVERVALVRVEAWDRNCPQRIPQRYTLAELGLPPDHPVPPVPGASSR